MDHCCCHYFHFYKKITPLLILWEEFIDFYLFHSTDNRFFFSKITLWQKGMIPRKSENDEKGAYRKKELCDKASKMSKNIVGWVELNRICLLGTWQNILWLFHFLFPGRRINWKRSWIDWLPPSKLHKTLQDKNVKTRQWQNSNRVRNFFN